MNITSDYFSNLLTLTDDRLVVRRIFMTLVEDVICDIMDQEDVIYGCLLGTNIVLLLFLLQPYVVQARQYMSTSS